jgi:preprotein translocase subunit Sss1
MESTSINRELLLSEIEALSMTLNDKDLKVEGSEEEKSTSVLVLTRRPSKEEWKDKIINGIEITVLPKNLEGEGDSNLSL